ncbi:hypothetical protein ACTFIR_003804 [Dictyostelium discoideum]
MMAEAVFFKASMVLASMELLFDFFSSLSLTPTSYLYNASVQQKKNVYPTSKRHRLTFKLGFKTQVQTSGNNYIKSANDTNNLFQKQEVKLPVGRQRVQDYKVIL